MHRLVAARWPAYRGVPCAHAHSTLFFIGATRGSTAPGVVYTANTAPSGWTGMRLPDALPSLLLTILLFSTARRGNGWIGVHELLSRTRVVQRNVPGPLHPPLRRRHLPISFPPFRLCDASDRTPCTRWSARPAADDCSSASIQSFAVMCGFTKFRQGHRRSSATRRDASRPGRLYWLAGRRSATENWDAFEAPRGEPFLTAPPTSDWRQVHRALSSLATELDASRSANDRDTQLSLAHVWRRAGRTTRAPRFPVARVGRAGRQSASQSCRAAGGGLHARICSHHRASRAAVGHKLLNRLASGAPPALADVKAELLRLASIPNRPSRIRRALPMVMAAMPVAVPILIVTVMLPSCDIVPGRGTVGRESPEVDDVDH